MALILANIKIRVRRKSIDVGFASLNVVSNPQGALAGPDASNVYTYTYDRSVTSVDIQATANSGNPVVGIGTHNIASGGCYFNSNARRFNR